MATSTMEKVRALGARATPGLGMGSQAHFRLGMLAPHQTAPFGAGATFPYTASTSAHHPPLESPFDMQVSIDPPHEQGERGCWRSGETVTGRVTLKALQEDVATSVLTLQVRCYCESRTLFWKVALPWEVDRPSGASPAPSASAGITPSLLRASSSPSSAASSTSQSGSTTRREAPFPAVLGHDFHRGTADSACLLLAPSSDPIPLAFTTAGSTHAWEFSMVLPPAIPLDESSLYTDSLGRRAPRDLSHVARSLPPTFRESRDASVEWVCEATLRLAEPPVVSDDASVSANPFAGMLATPPIPRYRPPRRRRRQNGPDTDRPPAEVSREGTADGGQTGAVANSTGDGENRVGYTGGAPLADGQSTSSYSSTPSIATTTATVIGGAMVDDQGFKLSRPPYLYVARAVFPFMPSDSHVHSHGKFNDSREGKGFGSWLLSRPETGGTTMDVREMPFDMDVGEGELEVVEGETSVPLPPEMEAEEVELRVFDKKVSVSPALGQLLGPRIGVITSQLLYPLSCSSVSRSTACIPLVLRLSHSGTSALSRLPGGGAGVVGGKVVIEKVCIVLSCRIVTRGGAEPKPHIALTELRRQHVVLDEGKNVVPTTPARKGRQGRDDGALAIRMRLWLQGAGEDGKSRPCAKLPPSFRTPNIELEYIVTVNVFPRKLPLFCAARYPLQLLAGGNFAEPPPFTPTDTLADALTADLEDTGPLLTSPPPPPHPVASPLPPSPQPSPPGSLRGRIRPQRPPAPLDLRAALVLPRSPSSASTDSSDVGSPRPGSLPPAYE